MLMKLTYYQMIPRAGVSNLNPHYKTKMFCGCRLKKNASMVRTLQKKALQALYYVTFGTNSKFERMYTLLYCL